MEPPDLEPLLRGEANEAERSLLELAKRDAARPGARDETLAALGFPVVAAPERFAVRFGRLLGSSGGSLLHGVLLALFIGAAAGAAVMFGSSSETASEPSVPSDARAESLRAPSPAEGSVGADVDLATAPVITPDSLPSAPAVASASPAKASAVSGTVPPTDTLAREISRVEAARAALERNEAARALELLDAYEREFSPGAFAVEVSVLRIEALAGAGQTDQARRLGARFLAEHRQGAFARRVAATLDALPGAAPPSSAERSPHSPDE